MGADQQFCLRWNNFHTNITSAFESLRDDEDFVDITLACEGRQIKAHKMVLSACSPYFRSLLKGNPCQHPIVFLKDVTFANLTSILDFMYHGEVNVSHNELATFLKTAEALKVRGLAEDEKKKDAENYNESSSPPPPRDPPDPGSPRPEEGSSAPDTHLSDSPPPKRQRRRSGASLHSAEDTNETVLSEARDSSVKNEPLDFNEEEDMLSQSVEQDLIKTDIDDSEERSFGPSESVTISRSQAAMQQLQESFGSFLPGMGQSPGFLPQGATDMPRPPPYPLEGVQGLPPGISALPGPSMSQGAASQDASQGAGGVALRYMGADYGGRGEDGREVGEGKLGGRPEVMTWQCEFCHKYYGSNNSLRNHRSVYHRRQVSSGSAKGSTAGVGGVSKSSFSLASTRPLLPPAQYSLSQPHRTPQSRLPYLPRLTAQNFGGGGNSNRASAVTTTTTTTAAAAPHLNTPPPPT
ncbi:protein bric-a-brac 2 isoform X11 [Cherax quadricarinatus]|uniref:protein bric-a-brac 2 isoform X11 n=1 Tax=Cherax quadricarinatus TaxID=27406 RepID=UPI002379355C|nr:protein bric-a-brac 2-like isoform X6 [Cherax quadricarinatus]